MDHNDLSAASLAQESAATEIASPPNQPLCLRYSIVQKAGALARKGIADFFASEANAAATKARASSVTKRLQHWAGVQRPGIEDICAFTADDLAEFIDTLPSEARRNLRRPLYALFEAMKEAGAIAENPVPDGLWKPPAVIENLGPRACASVTGHFDHRWPGWNKPGNAHITSAPYTLSSFGKWCARLGIPDLSFVSTRDVYDFMATLGETTAGNSLPQLRAIGDAMVEDGVISGHPFQKMQKSRIMDDLRLEHFWPLAQRSGGESYALLDEAIEEERARGDVSFERTAATLNHAAQWWQRGAPPLKDLRRLTTAQIAAYRDNGLLEFEESTRRHYFPNLIRFLDDLSAKGFFGEGNPVQPLDRRHVFKTASYTVTDETEKRRQTYRRTNRPLYKTRRTRGHGSRPHLLAALRLADRPFAHFTSAELNEASFDRRRRMALLIQEIAGPNGRRAIHGSASILEGLSPNQKRLANQNEPLWSFAVSIGAFYYDDGQMRFNPVFARAAGSENAPARRWAVDFLARLNAARQRHPARAQKPRPAEPAA